MQKTVVLNDNGSLKSIFSLFTDRVPPGEEVDKE